jgi:hypothetical protein
VLPAVGTDLALGDPPAKESSQLPIRFITKK